LSRDGVLTLIGRLHAYQDLVSLAYHNGELVKDETNARGVEHLQQHKVLIPRSLETFTLHTTLRRFFEAALNVERMYRSGADIGQAFERLDTLADALFVASHEGRAEDKERLEDESLQSIYEISDNLAAELGHLRALVENRFAAVGTLAEKVRQNAYYIGRTEKLVDAIELFTMSDLGERIQSQTPFANVAPMFTSQLLDRLPSFRHNLLGILRILQAYLFEFRSIEERTKRVRSMWLFLQRHPLYEPRDWANEPHPPDWLKKAPGIQLKASPSVRDPAYTDDLTAIAREILPPEVRLPVTRERGSLLLDDEDEEVIVLTPKAYQLAITAMLSECQQSGGSLSALSWFRDHPNDTGGMPPSLWLQCVLEEAYRPKAARMGLKIVSDDVPFEVFDGNALVRDVTISVVP
jgi:hypothetical protein